MSELTEQVPAVNDVEAMEQHAKAAAKLLKALSNEHRLLVLCLLCESEMSVSELLARVPLSQSALSQHLATLRRDGLVATRKEAQCVYYSLEGHEAQRVVELLHSLYCDPSGPLGERM